MRNLCFLLCLLLALLGQTQVASGSPFSNRCSDLFLDTSTSLKKEDSSVFLSTPPYGVSFSEFQKYLNEATANPINEDTRFKIAQTWKNASRASQGMSGLKPSELQTLMVQSFVQTYKTWGKTYGKEKYSAFFFHTTYLMYQVLATTHGFQFWKNRTTPVLTEAQILLQKTHFLNSLKLDLIKEYLRQLPDQDLDARLISFLLRNSKDQLQDLADNLAIKETKNRQIKSVLFKKNLFDARVLNSHELDLRYFILEKVANSTNVFLKEHEVKMLDFLIEELLRSTKNSGSLQLAAGIQQVIYLRVVRHVRYFAPPRIQDHIMDQLTKLENFLIAIRDNLAAEKKYSSELDSLIQKTVGSRVYYRSRKNIHLENKAAMTRSLQSSYLNHPENFMNTLGQEIFSFRYLMTGKDTTVETKYSILTTPREFQNFMSVVTNIEHKSEFALRFLVGHQEHNYKDLSAYWFFQYYSLVLDAKVRQNLVLQFLSLKPTSSLTANDFEVLARQNEIQNTPSYQMLFSKKRQTFNEDPEGGSFL